MHQSWFDANEVRHLLGRIPFFYKKKRHYRLYCFRCVCVCADSQCHLSGVVSLRFFCDRSGLGPQTPLKSITIKPWLRQRSFLLLLLLLLLLFFGSLSFRTMAAARFLSFLSLFFLRCRPDAVRSSNDTSLLLHFFKKKIRQRCAPFEVDFFFALLEKGTTRNTFFHQVYDILRAKNVKTKSSPFYR